MVWFSVNEELPLDTMQKPSLWLFARHKVIPGGYGATDMGSLDWYDENGVPLTGVTHWRAIMAWDEEPPASPHTKTSGLPDKRNKF